jgi:DNA-directed RNA polymerase subunit M/transcription elongation factor TFIIS
MNWNQRYAASHGDVSHYTHDKSDYQSQPGRTGDFEKDWVWNQQRSNNPQTYKCDECKEMKPLVRRRLQLRSDGSTSKFDVCTDCDPSL